MANYIIQGEAKIRGQITVSGAKNNALKALVATLLTDKPCRLNNVPDIQDINMIVKLMSDLGSKIEKIGHHAYQIDNSGINKSTLNTELARKLRSSIMFIAPLLARFKEARLPHPGGCIIGKRPIDFFVDGYIKFGASVEMDEENYIFKAKRLIGTKIIFPQISHTGTESMIMSAVLAKGSTEIVNAACEPEVMALADMLNKMGAKIIGAGTPNIIIHGVEHLHGIEYDIIADRIETGSFIALAAATNGELVINNCDPSMLEVPLELFKKAGVKMVINNDNIKITRGGKLRAIKVATHEYPGFPTDLQAPMTVLLTQANGLSMVHETIYESRLFYTDMLNRMGANIILCDPHRIIVQGQTELYGKKVESPDLRAGIAMVIAAAVATGQTDIDNIYQIERGYEDIVSRLQNIGLDISKFE